MPDENSREVLRAFFADWTSALLHEFGAPVRHVGSFVPLLMRSLDDEKSENQQAYAGHIDGAVDRLRDLLDGAGELARLIQDEKPMVAFESRDAIGAAVDTFGAQIELTGATLEMASDLPNIHGNPDQICRLFAALIDNSLKFTRPGIPARISVDAIRGPNEWEFCVRDEGLGVPVISRASCLRPFRQGTKDTPGNGIGLALVQCVAALHGGKVWLDSPSERSPGIAVHFTLKEHRLDGD